MTQGIQVDIGLIKAIEKDQAVAGILRRLAMLAKLVKNGLSSRPRNADHRFYGGDNIQVVLLHVRGGQVGIVGME